MPIVEIQIVLKPNEKLRPDIAQLLADILGEFFNSPKGGTWVKLRELPESQYAENGGNAEGVAPVFVHIIKSRLPSQDEMPNEVEKLTNAIAKICNRPPENTHIIYEPEGRGRIAFGGRLVT